MYVQRNERVRVTIVAVERLYIFSTFWERECVCVALVIHHAMRMRCIISSSVARLALPYFSKLYIYIYISYHTWHNFRKKVSWTKNVFWFSQQLLLLNTFHFKKNWATYCHERTWSSRKVPFFLSGFNETWISGHNFFIDTYISNFMKICTVGADLFHADGLTKYAWRRVALCNSANAPNNHFQRWFTWKSGVQNMYAFSVNN